MNASLASAALAALFACAALPAAAQDAKPAAKASATAGAKAPDKSGTAGKRRPARPPQKAVEEPPPIDHDPDVTISEADLEVAKQVHVGDIPCELGASVKVTPARRTGLFVVSIRKQRFLMHPVESRTGAIRLEDPKRGAMWLQLGNKSMLMSQKLGTRLADECQSPQQVTFAEELKRNPRPSILDPMPAAAASAATPAGAPEAPAAAAPAADTAPAPAAPAAPAPAADSAPATPAPTNNN